MPLPVVDVDELRVGPVVADDHVQITVAINVDEPSRIGTVCNCAEVVARSKVACAISEKYAIDQRPMTALHEHYVEMAIPVHITDAHVRRRLGRRLEQEHPVEIGKRVRYEAE